MYNGEWRNDKKNGKGKSEFYIGTYCYSNGDKYNGQYFEDKRNGKGSLLYLIIGIYIYKNGNKYEGDWLNDKVHGYGINNNKI